MKQYRVRIVLETTDENKALWHADERFTYVSEECANARAAESLFKVLETVGFYWRF